MRGGNRGAGYAGTGAEALRVSGAARQVRGPTGAHNGRHSPVRCRADPARKG